MTHATPDRYDEIESALKLYESEERQRLGLDEPMPTHWIDPNPQAFSQAQKASTTILCGGLTLAHDVLITGALGGLGYTVKALDCPDTDALRFGKEFGNRGQCNPTYFTVGNLIKYLTYLRDEHGLSTSDIIERYLFLTAGACGPCRFGTYVTEYRKALRDAGFEGFRVLLFQQQDGLKQATGGESGLQFNRSFFVAILKAIMAGDVLNAMGYRLRPYEVNQGETDAALERCKATLKTAFLKRSSTLRALSKCRRILSQVEVNRLQPKPKVSIIGEFWAMTTEGDGNYRLQRFLESEGAEVDIQLVSAWLLYMLWQNRYDTQRRLALRQQDSGKFGLEGTQPRKKLALMWVGEYALRGLFGLFARAIGLKRYHLADMDEIATISHQYYDNHLRGGEGHMEVGKLIQTVIKRKAHMVVSVKPFGCMPSSGVSDGVQSLITARYPEAIFTAIETTGDGAVNVQSRIQMDLFKARQTAQGEYDAVSQELSVTPERIQRKLGRRIWHALYYPKHKLAGTAANLLAELT